MQVPAHPAEALKLQKFFVDRLYGPDFLRLLFQLAGEFHLALHNDLPHPFRSIARGSRPPQPAPHFRKHQHVIPHPLGNGLPFQLGKHAGNIHHGLSHRGPCVKFFPNTDKGDPPSAQLFNEGGKVPHIAADSVQTITDQAVRFIALDIPHHPLELGPIQVFSRESLVLVDGDIALLTAWEVWQKY